MYTQQLVFSSIPWCEKMIKEQLNPENIFMLSLILPVYVETGAVIPSQSPFPFPIASFSLVAVSLLRGLGNLIVGSCYEHSYHLQNVTLKK